MSSFDTALWSSSSERRAVNLFVHLFAMSSPTRFFSLFVLGGWVSAITPRSSNYQITSTYDATNFLQSFDFIDVRSDLCNTCF